MAYTTRVKLNKKRPLARRTVRNPRKSFLKRLNLSRFKRVFYVGGGILLIASFIGALFLFAWLQQLTEKLPRPDKPFGDKNTASEILDRNGKLLYRVFGDENRDPVKISDVPPLVKWAYLSAEDIDFYEHPGVDVTAILRCGLRRVGAAGIPCGGSTITQQLIKLTAIDVKNVTAVERKVQEVILALQIEKLNSKDDILEMYLTVVPEGSNIYGVTQASKRYFNKDVKDLNLAETAVLAAIVNNPSVLSPLIPGSNATQLKERQIYIIEQMEKNKDKINNGIKEQGGPENALTDEIIAEAKAFDYVFAEQTQRDQLKAPHFVFYVEKLLTERGYNYGQAFTKENLQTSGYKITTTLDLDMQQIAEEQVAKAVSVYGQRYGAENAAIMALNPNNGEILSMVGSKDYFGKASPEGCIGSACRFSPKVNILDTMQSYGSSMKPMLYYYAMTKGLISAGSITPDIPIKMAGYGPTGPKNFEGGFRGIMTARKALSDSRNIPPIYMVDHLGVDNYVEELKRWGYSTLTDPRGYGPSIVVGGADIRLVEHAQAYGVLATGGNLVQHEAILKIEDKDGNIVYEAKPKSEPVADPRAVFIINDILNGRKGGPGVSWDKRDVSGKTGTSESQQETLFATYTPEVVVVGWLGNNNNDSMRSDTSGFGSARPWIAEYLERIGGNFPPTPFNRPSGVISSNGCAADEGLSCDTSGDLAIADIKAPAYVSVKSYTVCTDQTTRLAREIDKNLGYAQTITVKRYTMPNPKMQSFLDAYLESNGFVPTEPCDAVRSTPTPTPTPNPNSITITSPAPGAKIKVNTFPVTVNFSTVGTINSPRLYVDGSQVDNCSASSCTWNLATAGSHTLVVRNNSGTTQSSAVTVEVEL